MEIIAAYTGAIAQIMGGELDGKLVGGRLETFTNGEGRFIYEGGYSLSPNFTIVNGGEIVFPTPEPTDLDPTLEPTDLEVES